LFLKNEGKNGGSKFRKIGLTAAKHPVLFLAHSRRFCQPRVLAKSCCSSKMV
jgi:hypothetical protein